MIQSTTKQEFAAAYGSSRVVPVVRSLFADADTPVNIYRKLAADRPGTFLLESAEQGIFHRYSFVGSQVFGVLTERNGKAAWIPGPANGLEERDILPDGLSHLEPVEALNKIYAAWHSEPHPELPRLASGFVGYLGWESVCEFERVEVPDTPTEVPRQYMAFVADLAVIDHREGGVCLIANVLQDDSDPDTKWLDAQRRLDDMQAALDEPLSVPAAKLDAQAQPDPRRYSTQDQFFDMVHESKRRIVDGDIFQVVLSQRFDQECTAKPIDVYRVLRYLNPSPYLYLVNCENERGEPFAVVGSSPEALVTVTDGHVVTHPIAGSRPRGATVEEDLRFEEELLADPKERSEHLMLVDLARNDLSRVCIPGTVEVTEFMRIERFSHIMHISSIVEGDLEGEATPVDALRSTFPAGTLSGAPKPWALRIISELEPVRRGVYGGVVGYVGLGGDADLAIAIRTATIQNGIAAVQAGAGLVADSVPETEEAETRSKAAAPLRAVAIANTICDYE